MAGWIALRVPKPKINVVAILVPMIGYFFGSGLRGIIDYFIW